MLPRPTPDGPRVRLTLGKCLFTGMFDCPCTAGSIVANLRELSPESQCADCGHAVSLHQEIDEPPSIVRALPYLKPERGDLLTFSTPPEHSFEYKTDPSSSPARPQQQHPVVEEASNKYQSPRSSFPSENGDRNRPYRSLDPVSENRERRLVHGPRTGHLFQTASDPLPLAHGVHAEPDEFSFETATNDDDNSPYVCPRKETISTIAGIVQTRGAVLIWGLPGSGKSTLGQLLFEHVSDQDTKTVFIKDWPANKNAKLEELLAEFCQPSYPGTSAEDIINGDFVFIIDEADKSLQKLKRLIKNAITEGEKGPKFCLLNDQGQFAKRNSVFEMLPEVSYLATHGACAENVGIFFTQSEFEDVVSRTTSKSLGFRLSKEAANHVFSLTAGHPSIVRSILCYIDMHHAGALLSPRRRLKRLISLEGVVAVLHDDTRLFQYLDQKIYPGTFARQSNIAIKVFQKLLSSPQGRITWNNEYNTTGKCFENGLICHEIDINGADVFKFPSPLHERWARWYHMIQPHVYEGEMTPVFG